MRQVGLGVAVCLLGLFGAKVASAADDAPSYTKDVRPFLSRYCLNCHNDSKARGGYSVETFTDLTQDGRKGPLVVPEQPESSRLLLSLAGKGKAMPPRRAPQPREGEVSRLREWIKAGAPNDTPAEDARGKNSSDR